MNSSRYIVPLLALLALSLPHGAAATGPAPCDDCNVLLVTFDTLRADRLGAYGYQKPTSPSLDALAARSTVFLNHLSQSGSTLSSLPSLHTAKFPHLDRLLDKGHLRPSEETLAEILKKAGYETMAVIGHDFAGCKWGSCQGFEKIDENFPPAEKAPATLARARAMLASYTGKKPFFLWVHFRVPHTPYNPGPDLFRLFYDGPPGAPRFYEGKHRNLAFPLQISRLRKLYKRSGEPVETYRALGGKLDLTPSIVAQLSMLYDGNIRAGDNAFTQLMESLPTGQAARTVVVIGSDHGESLGAHRLIGHNRLYLEVLSTPLIVHVPNRPPARIDAPTMNVDILPTILAAVGQPIPPGIRGVDLLTQTPTQDRIQVAEYRSGLALLRKPWKLVHRPNRQPQLYLLPNETQNVAAEHPETVQELQTELSRLRASTPARALERKDTNVLEKLKALGYIRDGPPAPRELDMEGGRRRTAVALLHP